MINKADKVVRDFRHRLNEIAAGEIEPAESGAEAFHEAIVKAAENLVDDPEYKYRTVLNINAAK